jgi:hypothetical protein
VTTSRPWLGITTPPWLKKSDTPQLRSRVTRWGEYRLPAMRGQPTGGRAAPGGLPPVGRGMLPPRSRRVPLLPALARTALSLQLAIPPGDFRVHTRDLAGPGLAWRAEGVPLMIVKKVLTA